jgi:hypothetical protein
MVPPASEPRPHTFPATAYNSAPWALGHPPCTPASLMTSTRVCRNFGFLAASLQRRSIGTHRGGGEFRSNCGALRRRAAGN